MVSRPSLIARARNWYARYERPISSLSLIGGFVFNIFALTRVDEFKENFWIAIHILIVMICILLINRQENSAKMSESLGANPAKFHFWLITIMQFTFGGLLSTFLVFYFRGGALAVAWPFFIVLLVAFVANESLKRHYSRMYFQISFLFLSLFLFAIFGIPVLVHDLGPIVFIISGVLALVVLYVFLLLLKYVAKESLGEHKAVLLWSIVGIFVSINVLYFFNFIPPLPLSLHDAGVYHSIARTTDGNYAVTKESESLFHKISHYVGMYQTYHGESNRPVYVYTAVFSPTSFNLDIVHEWQKFDPQTKKWVTSGVITLPVRGGREGGFRTYSARTGITTGKWRVNVRTTSGQFLGRLVFSFEDTSVPELETEIKK